MWKTTLDTPRMLSREGGTMYELSKQTNKSWDISPSPFVDALS
jgi:hypothetical protein